MNTAIKIVSAGKMKSVVWDNMGKKTATWTRADAVRSATEAREKKEAREFIQSLRENKTVIKTARVKRYKHGFDAVGVGRVMPKEELYAHLRACGYKRIRMGGLMFNL